MKQKFTFNFTCWLLALAVSTMASRFCADVEVNVTTPAVVSIVDVEFIIKTDCNWLLNCVDTELGLVVVLMVMLHLLRLQLSGWWEWAWLTVFIFELMFVFVFALLFIIFKSLALSNLLNDVCVSRIMPGFLTIVPQFVPDVLFNCSTEVNGDDTDVTKIGAATFVSLFIMTLVFASPLIWLFFTLAKTNWFGWFCTPFVLPFS